MAMFLLSRRTFHGLVTTEEGKTVCLPLFFNLNDKVILTNFDFSASFRLTLFRERSRPIYFAMRPWSAWFTVRPSINYFAMRSGPAWFTVRPSTNYFAMRSWSAWFTIRP